MVRVQKQTPFASKVWERVIESTVRQQGMPHFVLTFPFDPHHPLLRKKRAISKDQKDLSPYVYDCMRLFKELINAFIGTVLLGRELGPTAQSALRFSFSAA